MPFGMVARRIRVRRRPRRRAAGVTDPPRGGAQGETPATIIPNITAHPTAGIGGWTDAEIIRAVSHGVARDGRPLKPPMAYGYYAGLTHSDLDDIIAYVRNGQAVP